MNPKRRIIPGLMIGLFLLVSLVANVPEANWLPTAPGKLFSLTWRTYIPKEIVKQGNWFPPAVSARD